MVVGIYGKNSFSGNMCRGYNFDRQSYNAIDLAKFLCSILVVMIHIPPFGSEDDIGVVRYLNYGVCNCLGMIAVPFFFVTSGFLLFRKTSYENFDIIPIKKYVLRLLKLYIIWSLIYLPIVVEYSKGYEVTYALLVYIRNFIFVGSYGQLWYLNATVVAVILISCLLVRKITVRKIMVSAFLFYIIGLLAQSWFGIIALMKSGFPNIWMILKLIQKVILTTRNGLFFRFLFVGMGMYYAFSKCKIAKEKALMGFIISIILMFLEALILKKINWVYMCDMYLFSIPTTYFGFGYIKQVELQDNNIYRMLRSLSSLIFYTHLWFKYLVWKFLSLFHEGLEKTCLLFIVTLIVTVICSILIIFLSDLNKLKWLKKLYA